MKRKGKPEINVIEEESRRNAENREKKINIKQLIQVCEYFVPSILHIYGFRFPQGIFVLSSEQYILECVS